MTTAAKESKSERFLRLVQARVPKALEAIRLIGQLGSANYESTTEEVAEINEVMTDSLNSAMTELGYIKTPDASATAVAEPTEPVARTTVTGPEWSLISQAYEALLDGDPDLAEEKLKEAIAL